MPFSRKSKTKLTDKQIKNLLISIISVQFETIKTFNPISNLLPNKKSFKPENKLLTNPFLRKRKTTKSVSSSPLKDTTNEKKEMNGSKAKL